MVVSHRRVDYGIEEELRQLREEEERERRRESKAEKKKRLADRNDQEFVRN